MANPDCSHTDAKWKVWIAVVEAGVVLPHAHVPVLRLELSQRREHALPLVLVCVPDEAKGVKFDSERRWLFLCAGVGVARPDGAHTHTEWEFPVAVAEAGVALPHAHVS
eukprot:364545-Prymnesium_polylepis.1